MKSQNDITGEKVKTMTLRGIDQDLEKALRREAESNSASLNATILDILRRATGMKKRKLRAVHHDIDHLAGTWSDEDKREFDEAVAPLSQIDEELWR